MYYYYYHNYAEPEIIAQPLCYFSPIKYSFALTLFPSVDHSLIYALLSSTKSDQFLLCLCRHMSKLIIVVISGSDM